MGLLSSIGKFFSGSAGALIGAGASLLGGSLQRSEDRRVNESNQALAQGMNAEDRAFAREWNERAEAMQRQAVQIRTADARAAGIHPLFALGAPGMGASFATPQSTGYAHQSGSGIGTGIAEAGRALGSYFDRRREERAAQDAARQAFSLQNAQERMYHAAALRDETAAMEIASRVKRAESTANSMRSAGDGVEILPMGTKQGTPLSMRAWRAEPNVSEPLWIEAQNEQGNVYKVLNPNLGMEEIAQAIFGFQGLREWGDQWRSHWVGRGRRAAGRFGDWLMNRGLRGTRSYGGR